MKVKKSKEGMEIEKDIVRKIREGKVSEDKLLKKVNYILEKVENYNYNLPKPSRQGLYTDKVRISKYQRKKWKKNPHSSYNVKINGYWVHPIFAKLVNMINNGITPVVFICGQQRYGKSKLGAYISYMLHNKLNVLEGDLDFKNQLIYSEVEYLASILGFRRKARILDEAEEYLNSYEHYTTQVRSVASSIRTLSILENIEIIISPNTKNISKRIREHIDFIISMEKKQYAKVTRIIPKKDKLNSRGYDNRYIRYPFWKVPDLPKKVIKNYEQIEEAYKSKNSLQILKNTLEDRKQKREEQEQVYL